VDHRLPLLRLGSAWASALPLHHLASITCCSIDGGALVNNPDSTGNVTFFAGSDGFSCMEDSVLDVL
jgi:hypothetical protein